MSELSNRMIRDMQLAGLVEEEIRCQFEEIRCQFEEIREEIRCQFGEEIRCQFGGGNPVSVREEIRCQFVFSGKNDELTPNFPTPNFPRMMN